MDIASEKKRLRQEMMARRDAARRATGGIADEGAALVEHFAAAALGHLHHATHDVVSGYWPMGSEVDVRPLLHLLERHGFTIGLPVVVAKGAPLAFRRWRRGAPMEKGVWGIEFPADPFEVTPRALLVPLLAFDGEGHRLGYGGGFYDRTIARLKAGGHPPLTIGVALECQKIDAVPHEPWDERLDIVVTQQSAHIYSPLLGPAERTAAG